MTNPELLTHIIKIGQRERLDAKDLTTILVTLISEFENIINPEVQQRMRNRLRALLDRQDIALDHDLSLNVARDGMARTEKERARLPWWKRALRAVGL